MDCRRVWFQVGLRVAGPVLVYEGEFSEVRVGGCLRCLDLGDENLAGRLMVYGAGKG
ncbi:MAG: hypothetical protein N2595_10820 [bacterium]|nr:hypothetical protein [bacterium]